MLKTCALTALCLTLMPGVWTAHAQTQNIAGTIEPDVPEKIAKDLQAFRIRASAPRIDGRLDDETWKLAESIDDFVQMEPANMQPATERTVVQIAYDQRYIYVAVRCYSRDSGDVTTALGRRDNIPRSDRVYIDFDPRHDHQTGYVFQVNPSGVQGDFTAYDDTSLSFDYDGVWEAGTQVTTEGWNAEFRIPFSQMRFDIPPGESAVWGFNLTRNVAKTGEMSRWVPTPRGVNGFVSRFGHLHFADRLTPPRRIELLPFTLAGIERSASAGNSTNVNAGLDLRMGFGSSTLSATINPDFGQVEADPAVLNLSVFETFFPEKRPFFLEDSRIFVLPYGQMPDFYSRRIGQVPGRIALNDDETLIEKPNQTTILGAAKITGKASGWTYGGLGVVTAREYASVDVTTTQSDGTTTVARRHNRLIEPATLYSVGRLQRDIRGSNIGIIGTAVVREQELDAFTGGPDFNLRWARNRFNLNGHWLATHAPVSGVMRTDFGGLTNFSYDTKHVDAFAHIDHFGKNFRNTDLGFLSTRTNKNDLIASIGLAQPDPWKMFRYVNGNAGVGRQWTGERLVFGSYAYFNTNLQFRNYWWIGGGLTHNFRTLDDLDTRGGPPIESPAGNHFNIYVEGDSRKPWAMSFFVNGGEDDAGAWNAAAGPTVRVQVSDRLQTTVSASYSFAQNVAQWIKNEDLDGDDTKEHVYGRLRRDVVNITGRATYAFSREMTLEAYLQPFVAAGDYTDIRKLARPRSFDFTPVAISDDPDFNRKSLRGTIVMRWEYLRGSTLFLVWNMATSDATRPGVFSPWRGLGAGFGAPGTHVFVAKLSYWFTP